MNEHSITAEQISSAKRRSPVRLRQRMQVQALPQDGSHNAMTFCTLNAVVSVETAHPKVVRILHVQTRLVFIQGSHGYVYVVDADANTCTCPVWRKHRDCSHIKAVREHFYI